MLGLKRRELTGQLLMPSESLLIAFTTFILAGLAPRAVANHLSTCRPASAKLCAGICSKWKLVQWEKQLSGRFQLLISGTRPNSAEKLIEHGTRLAHETGMTITISILIPRVPQPLQLFGGEYITGYISDLNGRMEAEARRLSARAQSTAEAIGVTAHLVEPSDGEATDCLRECVMASRTHDFTLLGLSEDDNETRGAAEELLFDSGRPLLVFPTDRPMQIRFDRIVVCWDHSEAVARAVSGSLAFLKRAREVLVLTGTDTNRKIPDDGAVDAAAYLRSHSIPAEAKTLEQQEGQIVDAAVAHGADLIVMGAYSTMRARQYLLGGVTRRMLLSPPLPILAAN